MRGFPALIHQFLDALMLFSAMVPDGTSKLGLCLGNAVPQAPDLIIREVFHEKRVKLSAGQSQVTSISSYLTGCAASSPSRSLPTTPQFAAVPRLSHRTCDSLLLGLARSG